MGVPTLLVHNCNAGPCTRAFLFDLRILSDRRPNRKPQDCRNASLRRNIF